MQRLASGYFDDFRNYPPRLRLCECAIASLCRQRLPLLRGPKRSRSVPLFRRPLNSFSICAAKSGKVERGFRFFENARHVGAAANNAPGVRQMRGRKKCVFEESNELARERQSRTLKAFFTVFTAKPRLLEPHFVSGSFFWDKARMRFFSARIAVTNASSFPFTAASMPDSHLR